MFEPASWCGSLRCQIYKTQTFTPVQPNAAAQSSTIESAASHTNVTFATRLLALLATHLLLTLALYLSTSPHTHTHTHTHPPPLLYAPLVLCLAADTAEISALITRTEDGVPRPPTWAMVVGETLVVGLSSVGWVLYKPGASFALTEEGRWGGRLWVGVAGLV
ncbi:hypothetical protein PMIN03_012022 [Paraphaeosphaeria minitans]